MPISSPLQEEVTMGRGLQVVKTGNEAVHWPHPGTKFP